MARRIAVAALALGALAAIVGYVAIPALHAAALNLLADGWSEAT